MASKIGKFFKRIAIKRTTVLIVIFTVMSAALIYRLFDLQIVNGSEYTSEFNTMTTKTRAINTSRGTIYDRNGNILAEDQLSYSVTIEDNGTYETTREKNLTLNSICYQLLQLFKENGDEPVRDFHIVLDANNNYVFDTTNETTLARFRADVYGHSLTTELTSKEAKATPAEIMNYLTGKNRFAIVLNGKNAYTEKELKEYDLPEEYEPQDLLDITIIRYALSNNSYQKYVAVTIATDISEKTVATIMENADFYQGVEIVEDTIRVYNDAEYFSNIIGYTGTVSTEELEELEKESDKYDSSSVVGKIGIEAYMETELQGTKGEETVIVDNLGTVMGIDEKKTIEPEAGNDIYLSLDRNLQIVCYNVLEQQIAGILVNHIINAKTFDASSVSKSNEVMVPIYDVYKALVGNSIIDISHFAETDASDTERTVYEKFQQKQQSVFDQITYELTTDQPTTYANLSDEMQEYVSYVVDDLLTDTLNMIMSDEIDSNDETYVAWNKEHSISLQEYLTYASREGWIDLSVLATEGEYLDSNEIYEALAPFITDYLSTDLTFSKLLYENMIMDDEIDGSELCMILYDQGVLDKKDDMYKSLSSGKTTPYDFLVTKISNLEITPGQLALDPYCGSIVVTDPNNGEILACVSYPGYDNNRLVNHMDVSYYNQLLYDEAQPMFNKATQQRTAPGSTFKPISTMIGLEEGLISTDYTVDCTGVFDLVEPAIECTGVHGNVDVVTALEYSCNVFFSNVGFLAGTEETEDFSEARSLALLQEYADMMDMNKKTGIEIDESAPQVSNALAVPSYIGQGTHLYTTTELARYVSTLANRGTSYDLSLIHQISSADGTVLQEYEPVVESTVNEISDATWDVINTGMRLVVETHEQFDKLKVQLAGKTGTAEESADRPDHGLFIGYAPYDDPEYALAIRIPYGYGSGNACLVANDVVQYLFKETKEKKLVTGTAATTTSDNNDD